MGDVTTIGLDLAKRVFQVHGIDASGAVTLARQVRRAEMLRLFSRMPRCLIGMEACATAHLSRELTDLGHEVRLIPPHYVKPYVRRNKSDQADAAAICEAVGRPSMRFVPAKSAAQQAALVVHRARDVLVRQQTMLTNALRAHLAEFGLVEARGKDGLGTLIEDVEATGTGLPEVARQALLSLVRQIASLAEEIAGLDRQLRAVARENDVARRLQTVPGIGPVSATALAATVVDAKAFRSGREFAAWLGLVPRQHSTGGKARLGGISKRGDRYLRRLLVSGAQAVLLRSKMARSDPWLVRLRAQKPLLKVAVALANKLARIAWAIMTRNETYRQPTMAAATA
jgi:transposase